MQTDGWGVCLVVVDALLLIETLAKVIPIYNREGEQMAAMEETIKARPTPIHGMLNGGEELEGEVVGGEGVQIELPRWH